MEQRIAESDIRNYENACYFWSLVRKQTRKKRSCIKCGLVIKTMSSGDRYCSQCIRAVPHVGRSAVY